MHPALAEAMKPYGTRARLVRKRVPLPGHPNAFGAAMAHQCADAQGRGEAMAHLLFTSDRIALEDRVEHARTLGLDLDAFGACLTEPATRAAIEREVTEVREGGLEGLPTVYVGSERIVGFDAEAGATPYVDALARAARGESARPPRWPLPSVIALALLVLAPALWRPRGGAKAAQ
jgi:predicted DsbA family dithiol-disulfide isomerase